MFPSTAIANSTSQTEEATASSETKSHDFHNLTSSFASTSPQPNPRKKRSQPGNPDPEAEVVAMSPESLMATNRFVCEICNKGFQRDQNLQLHRRGHNLPWRLRQSGAGKEVVKKRVYVCPESSCVHHHPSRALGDLTGIKKHFCRKHGEKKWTCDKCSKKYAVFSDWKAHAKACGSKEYLCGCGTLFSRKDSFITHRAFCDALAEESARIMANLNTAGIDTPNPTLLLHHPLFPSIPNGWNSYHNLNQNLVASLPIPIPIPIPIHISIPNPNPNPNPNTDATTSSFDLTTSEQFPPLVNSYLSSHHLQSATPPQLSATALLQEATKMGHLNLTASRSFELPVSLTQTIGRSTLNFLDINSGDPPGEELLPLPDHAMNAVKTGGESKSRSGGRTKPVDRCGFLPVTGARDDHYD